MDHSSYQEWRNAQLKSYPQSAAELFVEIGGFLDLSDTEKAAIMAGKVHALMTRKYSKGRDWYDLLWYLSRRPSTEPNLILLQNVEPFLERPQDARLLTVAHFQSILAGYRMDSTSFLQRQLVPLHALVQNDH